MIDAALASVAQLASFEVLSMLILGVFAGLTIGIVPGLGGTVGMAVLLPFVFGMDPLAGIFLLIGMSAVTTTSDAFPAVLFGIPGSASGQATVLDGHPLASRGEAGRALGASFSAAMFGGIVGGLVLLAILPLARPLVLAMGSPELLMLSLLGLATVGLVSSRAPLLGTLSAVMGLVIASIGSASMVYQTRYTLGIRDLQDGVSIIVLALGLFAIPEMMGLLVQGRPVARLGIDRAAGVMSGVRDTLRNWRLVLSSSAIGSAIGMLPGVGGPVVTWVNYALSSRSRRNKVEFGKGEIRGVIAPDAGANATEGGTLVPTLLFGIPGSPTAAVLLGGLVLMGIQPGPSMLNGDGLVVLLSVVWALVLANVLATGLCLVATRWMVKMTILPPRLVAPLIVVIVILASYQAAENWTSLWVLAVLGLLGWIMQTLGIPRVPLLIGFVLGPSVERYLWISQSRYGFEWMLHPGVLVIFALIVALVWFSIRRRPRRPRAADVTIGKESR